MSENKVADPVAKAMRSFVADIGPTVALALES